MSNRPTADELGQEFAALETAHEQITQLAGAEHTRMEHQNRLARAW